MYKFFPSFLFILFTFIFFVSPSLAKSQITTDELINIAGKQRMLSQKIAKAYFFYSKGIRPEKTKKQLTQSLKEFNDNFDLLKTNIKDKDIQDMLQYIELTKDELGPLIKQAYSKDNGTEMLDYSETLLEGSNDIVHRLEASSKKKTSSIINLSGRQRMLTQRIAKYYIVYQSGFKDKATIDHLKQAMSEFEQAHKTLAKYKKNTTAIQNKLNKVAKLWNVVNKFYSNVEQGGLPVIVLSTSDKIMSEMNKVTQMYVKLLN